MRWPSLVKGFTQSMPLKVSVDAVGIDEDGAPITGASWSGKANWQDHPARSYTGRTVQDDVRASVYIDGDPFPRLFVIAGGSVRVGSEEREIVQGMKARNPDSTVNYTRLDLR